jgi:hypothetical protein
MCIVLYSAEGLRCHAVQPDTRFFFTAVTDGFGTDHEKVLFETFPALAARLPIDTCLAALFFLPEECQRFKVEQDLNGLRAPFIMLSEENPFLGVKVPRRAVIELGALSTTNDVRRILASVAEQAHDNDFLRRARNGEMLRRVERALAKYGQPIKDCLHLVGFG